MKRDKDNFKLIISYDGTRYYGWEHQPGIEMTIQGKLEKVLEKMVGEEVEVIGAGRTDAGVHARAMVANIKLPLGFEEEQVMDYMNRYLPDDICIVEVRKAGPRFHSRYNATGKTYRYTCYVGNKKPVFDRKYVYTLDRDKVECLNISEMKKAAAFLMGEHDFASFCANPKMKKSTVRNVDSIKIEQDGDYIHLTYHGTGFLQHMVRILTGTILEVGFGKRKASDIPKLIEIKDRKKSGFTAPAQGLCLIEVDYS